jgi:hypothetical protein
MGKYRVLKVTSNHFGEFNHGTDPERSESELWSGSDTSELSRRFPPSEVFGADPLGHSEIEDGLIRFDHEFQELREGEWVTIADPRVRQQQGMTVLEREQDAENRRLYPGDFIEDDDDDWDYYNDDNHDNDLDDDDRP